MKTVIQFALPAEFHALPGAGALEPMEVVSGVPIYDLGDGLLACTGGVGKVNAALAAEILCLHCHAELILNAGVAGCCTELPTGSLVVASEFVQHDMDTSAIGDPVGLVSTVNQTVFPTWEPDRCVKLLRELGAEPVTGRVATGDWFATGGTRAEWIQDTFQPLLLEMEGGAIAQVCLRNQVPMVAVKTVSDHLFADNQVAEYFDFQQAMENLGKLILPFARALQALDR